MWPWRIRWLASCLIWGRIDWACGFCSGATFCLSLIDYKALALADNFAFSIVLSSVLVVLRSYLTSAAALVFWTVVTSDYLISVSGFSTVSSVYFFSSLNSFVIYSVSLYASNRPSFPPSSKPGFAYAALFRTRSIPPNFLLISSIILLSCSSDTYLSFSLL